MALHTVAGPLPSPRARDVGKLRHPRESGTSQVDATGSFYFQVAPEECFDLSPLDEKASARFLEYTQRRRALARIHMPH